MMKFSPGARTPTSRPNRNTTPPSYCLTIFTPSLSIAMTTTAAAKYIKLVLSMPASPGN